MIVPTFIVVVPAYNEGYSIERCVRGIIKAAEFCSSSFRLKAIIICVNGCTDNTEAVVSSIGSRYPIIEQIHLSANNYLRALNALFVYAREHHSDSLVIKLDADSIPQANSFAILLGELKRHQQLLIVGGHPIVVMPKGLTLSRRLLARVLAVRAFFPQGEVAAASVAQYHQLAYDDPQPIGPAFESRSKIYFHGRFWAARHSQILHLSQRQLGDDVYLTARLYRDFGPGVIRVRYDANCQFEPNYTIARHFLTYRRINADIHRLYDDPSLAWYVQASRTKINWSYVAQIPLVDQVCFSAYYLISAIEHALFAVFPYRPTDWVYTSKHPPTRSNRAK